MAIMHLSDRGVVAVSGDDAEKFLQGLVTCDLARATPARYGALLSPQGKILFDFIIERDADGFLLDTPAAGLADLVKRLSFYKLRAQVEVRDVSEHCAVLAGWDAPGPDGSFPDPRLAELGWRAIVDRDEASRLADADAATYHAHRIVLGVPESGKDYIPSDTFPHEAAMDQLGGVDFDKGCFIGQEVVSRMQHRGTARTRAVPVVFPGGAAASEGIEVMAGAKAAGYMGSSASGRGIAVVRLDRVADALAAGEAITAGNLPLRLEKPLWARFAFPGEPA